jgi:hypothetical protein
MAGCIDVLLEGTIRNIESFCNRNYDDDDERTDYAVILGRGRIELEYYKFADISIFNNLVEDLCFLSKDSPTPSRTALSTDFLFQYHL